MSGFGRTSAPVAICSVLGFLEALNSYKFDYIKGFSHASTGVVAPACSQLHLLGGRKGSDLGKQLPLMLVVSCQDHLRLLTERV
jgi:hypothetical protein